MRVAHRHLQRNGSPGATERIHQIDLHLGVVIIAAGVAGIR